MIFFTAGAPQSAQCSQNLGMITDLCKNLGLPLATEKVESPSTLLVFLGILLDSTKMEMRLPDQKLQNLKTTITDWLEKKAATKRDMLSLIGPLSYATKVVQKAEPSCPG